MAIYLINITIRRSNPQIVRKLLVHSETLMSDLFEILNKTLEWSEQTYEFAPENRFDACETNTLRDLFALSQLTSPEYEFPIFFLQAPMLKVDASDWRYRNLRQQIKKQNYWHFYIQLNYIFANKTELQELKEHSFLHEQNLLPIEQLFIAETTAYDPAQTDSYRTEGETSLPPVLINLSGLHPYQKSVSMPYSNKICEEMSLTGYYYDYITGNLELELFNPDIDQINKSLASKTKYYTAHSIFYVHKELGRNLVQMFEACTTDSLKQIIRYHQLGLKYNIKKAELIQNLAAYMNKPSFWRTVLSEMKMTEYQAFRNVIDQSHPVEENSYSISQKLPTLISYGLIAKTYSGKYDFCFAKQFLDYFETFANDFEAEANLLAEKRMQNALFVAGNLYGIFSGRQCAAIYKVLYPELYNVEDFEKRWNPVLQETPRWKNIENAYGYYTFNRKDPTTKTALSEILYDSVYLHGTDIYYLQETIQKNQKKGCFLPDQTQAQEILSHGMNFTGDALEKLYYAVDNLSDNRSYWSRRILSPQEILQKIYETCRTGWNLEYLMSDLKGYNFDLKGTSTQFKELKELLKYYLSFQIRRYDYLGYTREEWKRL